jgi:hypothetical protein
MTCVACLGTEVENVPIGFVRGCEEVAKIIQGDTNGISILIREPDPFDPCWLADRTVMLITGLPSTKGL